jgi:uncharacterized protein YdhG (YjbR/CyaY superfamily)
MIMKNDNQNKPVKSVDDYLLVVPEDFRAVLDKLRQTIKKAAPKAEEVISYRMPAYKYLGTLVYFAAFKNHCSFFPGSKSIIRKFAKELKPFKTSAGTIQFTADNPIPASLVEKIIKLRMKENEERQNMRQSKKNDGSVRS